MKKIFLDTNFLMAILQLKIDIFSEIERIISQEYQIFVLDKTVDELNKIISEQRTKEKKTAKFALDAIKLKNLNIYRTKDKKNVDDALFEISKDKDAIIATLDKELKKRLKGDVLIVRQKRFLAFSWGLSQI